MRAEHGQAGLLEGALQLQLQCTELHERVVFGRPIGSNQGIQFPIAAAYAEIEAADLMARKAAALFDAGVDCGAEANIAKHLGVDIDSIGVKATTNEKLGPEGNEKGISSYSVALLRRL